LTEFVPKMGVAPHFNVHAGNLEFIEGVNMIHRWILIHSYMLLFLDILLTVVHLALIVFNLAGWTWPATRRIHLVALLVTAASWFILGIWYGMGYCPLTDWHWNIKEQRGETNLPASFVKYIGDKVSGQDIDPSVVDTVTVSCLVFALLASLFVNIRDWLRKRS
jgi:hypothetical protein